MSHTQLYHLSQNSHFSLQPTRVETSQAFSYLTGLEGECSSGEGGGVFPATPGPFSASSEHLKKDSC